MARQAFDECKASVAEASEERDFEEWLENRMEDIAKTVMRGMSTKQSEIYAEAERVSVFVRGIFRNLFATCKRRAPQRRL